MLTSFIFIFIGALVGSLKNKKIIRLSDTLTRIFLVILMFSVGVNVGADSSLLKNIFNIGIDCVIISVLTILFSALFCFLVERKALSLNKVRVDTSSENTKEDLSASIPLFLITIPFYILLGMALGYFLQEKNIKYLLDNISQTSLMIIYFSVGITIGSDYKALLYIRSIGIKTLFFPLAILLGSLMGGIIASFFTSSNLPTPLVAAAGMSYYSVTGAYMTSTYGDLAGTYGFITNVLRECFTLLALPILARFSRSAPLAGGAAGCLDTMLMPVTISMGKEYSLLIVFTGVSLTILVPFLLPFLSLFFV